MIGLQRIPYLACLAFLCGSADVTHGGNVKRLLVFAGAAAKPALEDAAARYKELTGVEVDISFGGSGYVLSQMQLARRGDVYIPGSSDYMEHAKRVGAVVPETERILVYLVPAINVRKGNPHRIHTLRDLTRPGLRVAIANPEHVCVGAYAVEIIERALSAPERAAFRSNLVTFTESCEKTATVLALGTVDAVIGWSVFAHWDPARIETVPLPPHQVPRIGYIPAAVSAYTRNRAAAENFIDFLVGPEGQRIFARHHYFARAADAAAWLGAERPVGGEYHVPATWQTP